ncbi:DUF4397 domain-containing protein [Halosimplex litoreum]|uniref:DUF4397 domain-containing protein n=1 Tax=Halosimplex litoreum TaxID=1198301 RepID=UPI001E5CD09B|nr:DUF4397 domain-containing protein [Halosimplex litoreum]
MTNKQQPSNGGREASQSNESSADEGGPSRRTFLKGTAAAGAVALGVGAGAVGSASAGIPTPQLHRDGNLIKDPDGNVVTLRGVNIADPKRINVTSAARGKDAVQVIDMLTDASNGWYPRTIRVPVQPVDIGEYEPGSGPPVPAFDETQLENYLTNHLDEVVERCKERGVYCIIDYHRHRDVSWAEGQSGPVNTELQDEVDMFWDIVAPRYSEDSHVLYEVYNEPTEPGMWEDPTDTQWVADIWQLWLEMAQPWVDTIRSHADNLILMGSPSWTQSPEGALVEEFDGEDIAYTFHIYPGHNSSRQQNWEDASINGEGVNGVYEQAPLFVTEFGWEENGGQYIGGTDEFGDAFHDFLEKSEAIHWTAWCADPVWRPVMFDRPFAENVDDAVGDPYNGTVPEACSDLPCEWSLTTGSGGMGDDIKSWLEQYRNDGIPGDGTVTPPTDTPDTPTDEPAGSANLRVAHFSPDAPNVDVYVDGTAVLTDVPFRAVSDYLEVSAGTHTVEITAAGDASNSVFEGDVTVADGSDYTVAAVGELDADTQFRPLVLEDDNSDIGDDMARVRLLHASPDAPAVDVTTASGSTLFDGVSFGQAGYVEVPAGNYTLQVRGDTAGNDGDVVASFDVGLAGDTVYTGFAGGYLSPGDEPTSEAFDLALSVDSGPGGSPADETAPPAPTSLSVASTSTDAVTVDWMGVSDSGGSGLAEYAVYLDGSMEQTVPAGTTEATVDGLSADTTYTVGVAAVDNAGNESAQTSVTATTEAADTPTDEPDTPTDEPPADAMVVDDYDGDPGWANHRNDLGQWCGAGSFANGGGEETGGALVLEYDNGGWFQEQINESIEEYSTLVFEVSGANGGEESEVLFDMGGVRTMLSNVTDDSIGTSMGEVRVDLESAGVDRSSSSLSVRFNFWQGGSSTLELSEIRLE